MTILDKNDDSLDAFVRDYCATHAIECDGDVFGLMFAEKDQWSETEAIAAIEEGARLYNLK